MALHNGRIFHYQPLTGTLVLSCNSGMRQSSENTPETILASRDPTLRALIRQHGLCPLAREPGDPIFALFSAIISQQISTHAANSIRGRFIALCGDKTNVWATKIKRRSESELRDIGLSRSKATAVLTLAEALADHTLDFAKLSGLSDKEVIGELTQYKGVGPWTAEMVMLFGLRRLDIFTHGDLGIKRGIQIAYQLRKLPSSRRMNEISRPWKPYRGIASWYMWRVVDPDDKDSTI